MQWPSKINKNGLHLLNFLFSYDFHYANFQKPLHSFIFIFLLLMVIDRLCPFSDCPPAILPPAFGFFHLFFIYFYIFLFIFWLFTWSVVTNSAMVRNAFLPSLKSLSTRQCLSMHAGRAREFDEWILWISLATPPKSHSAQSNGGHHHINVSNGILAWLSLSLFEIRIAETAVDDECVTIMA